MKDCIFYWNKRWMPAVKKNVETVYGFIFEEVNYFNKSFNINIEEKNFLMFILPIVDLFSFQLWKRKLCFNMRDFGTWYLKKKRKYDYYYNAANYNKWNDDTLVNSIVYIHISFA